MTQSFHSRPLWRRLLADLLTRAGIAAVLAGAALFVFATFSAEINRHGKLQKFDLFLLHFFKTHQTRGIHEIMAALTYLAGPIPQTIVLLLCISYFAFRRKWPEAATLLFAGVGGVGVVSGFKTLFHRPRPEEIFAPLGFSFPSGHSFFALVVYGLTAYFVAREQKNVKRKRMVWMVGGTLAFLVGFSRVYLGQHFPSDVGAGYALAFFWVWVCSTLPPAAWRLWKKRYEEEVSSAAPVSATTP